MDSEPTSLTGLQFCDPIPLLEFPEKLEVFIRVIFPNQADTTGSFRRCLGLEVL